MGWIAEMFEDLIAIFVDAGDPLKKQASSVDPIGTRAGLHLLSDFGAGHQYVSSTPDDQDIKRLMKSLNWTTEFHQVILVGDDESSMEVGGSLAPEHGLSAVYRNPANSEHHVTDIPPSTVDGMLQILLQFHRGSRDWNEMFGGE